MSQERSTFSCFDEGSTLLEVLIGIALTTMLLLFLSEAAIFADQSFLRVKDAGKQYQAAVTFRTALTQSLEAAYPLRRGAWASDNPGRFKGTEKQLQFSVYGGSWPPDLITVSIDEGVLSLERTGHPNLTLSAAASSFGHSDDLCLRYFGVEDGVNQAAWHAAWDFDGRLPSLVSIADKCEVSTDLGAAGKFMLPISAPGACQFDELLQRCRGGV